MVAMEKAYGNHLSGIHNSCNGLLLRQQRSGDVCRVVRYDRIAMAQILIVAKLDWHHSIANNIVRPATTGISRTRNTVLHSTALQLGVQTVLSF